MGAFQIFTQPSQQALDTAANVLSGATLTFSLTGTSTPTNAYSDSGLTTPVANPLSANSAGVFIPVFLDPTVSYRIVLKTQAGAVLQTWDPANENVLALLTQNYLGQILYPRISAEISAGVTPVNYAYAPGVDLRYGVVRDDATDNQTAITNLIAVGAQGVQIVLTPGIARHSNTLDWSCDSLRVAVQGKSQLRHTGTGVANKIDGGTSSGALFNIQFSGGYLEELGNANTTEGWLLRGLGRCDINVRAKNANTYGIHVQFAVLCTLRLGMTANDGVAYTTPPPVGVILDARGASETTAYCRFPNLFVEGLAAGTGLILNATLGNEFTNGSCEGCSVGLKQNGTPNDLNTFYDFDFEANTANDVLVTSGTNLKFVNCQSVSSTSNPTIDLQGGESTTFVGGYYSRVNCQSGATNTCFFGCQVPSGGPGIQNTGSKKIVGVSQVNTVTRAFVGALNDELGEQSTFTPTIFGNTVAGSQTFSKQEGFYTRVGKRVDFTINLVLTANSGGSGTALIGGLPFTSRTTGNQTVQVNEWTGITLSTSSDAIGLRIAANTTQGSLIESGASSAAIAITAISATASLSISGSYQLA